MNSYERHKQVIGQSSYLYYSTKEIFGKPVKSRLFKKWHHRYMRERNRDIKRLGKQNRKENKIYFGRIVYTYYSQHGCESKLAFYLGENKLVFTCKPRCKHSQLFPLNYAEEERRGFL